MTTNKTGTEIYKSKRVKNDKGVYFCPGKDLATGLYIVFQLCGNYDGRVRGGMAWTWRAIAEGLTLDQAKALLNKKAGRVEFV